MDTIKQFGLKILDAFKRVVLFLVKGIPLGIYGFFKSIVLAIINFFKNLKKAKEEEPEAFKKGLMSFFLMGLGQFKNKQWYKGAPILGVFLLFLIIEIATSGYWWALSGEIAQYPAEGELHFFRDYGGLFTKGLWGLFTLGAVTTYSTYRGVDIRPRGAIFGWDRGDNSRVLLGEGVIVLVLIALLFILWIVSIRDAYKTHLKVAAGKTLEDAKAFYKRIAEDYFAYLIIVPALILITFFILIPFIFSFLVAFTNYTDNISLGRELIQWHGFDTFLKVFNPEEDWFKFFNQTLLWTLFYAFMSSVTVYVLGLVQALIIESKYVVGKKVWRTIFILPWAIPGMIILLLFSNVFGADQGLLNNILATTGTTATVREFLETIGLVGQASDGNILWFTSSENAPLARTIIILVNLWMGFPYFMLMITGVLTTIPKMLVEAADIDGATSWQKFRYLTLPWVIRGTAPVIITTFTFNFNNFGMIYFLTGGGPGYPRSEIPQSLIGIAPGQTDILISWIYKLSFESTVNQFNLAAAYSILIFLLIGVVALVQLSRLKSFWEEE